MRGLGCKLVVQRDGAGRREGRRGQRRGEGNAGARRQAGDGGGEAGDGQAGLIADGDAACLAAGFGDGQLDRGRFRL